MRFKKESDFSDPIHPFFFLVLAFFLVASLSACKKEMPTPKAATSNALHAVVIDEQAAAQFLEKHWDRPLAPQDKNHPTRAASAISLKPENCASCHAAQYKDWSNSLHSKAMGPGLMGQLLTMPAHAKSEHQACIRCHAPLAEQADSLVAALKKQVKPQGHIKIDSNALHQQGLVCAACHVRQGEVYGPSRRDGSSLRGDLSAYPHQGWKTAPAFESAQFCAACHQFKSDDYALNGKLLENTYQEWLDSRYARQGVSCQSCHMPDRRHLWKGIHDADTVKKGIEIRADHVRISEHQLSAKLTINNSGVGHFFPTYVTPKVVIRGFQQDASGKKLPGTEQVFVVGRQVTLDISEEIADTRIAPDAEASFAYRVEKHRSASSFTWQVEIQPDAFYLEFYRELLKYPTKGESKQLITQARDDASASIYQLYAKNFKLP